MAFRILADENIPFVREAFGAFGEVRLVPGRCIRRDVLRAVDVLLVRSVTPVGAALLAGTPVRFVGTATIGTDHVDVDWLRREGIAFAHAPGSNAGSVVEYVLAALLRLAVRRGVALRGRTAGIVGCGHIGGRLVGRLRALGMEVLVNDPPLVEALARGERPPACPLREGDLHFVPFDEVLATADVLSLHVPLTRSGPYATDHLIDAAALARMKPGAWLVNTARGAVVDGAALQEALRQGTIGAAVLDVWEGEPAPDPALIARVDLGTPHIAGYSYDGKVAGTVMLYRAFTAHFGLAPAWDAGTALAPAPTDRLTLTPPDPALDETAWLDAVVRQMYDIEADDRRFRPLATLPPPERAEHFSLLRKTYPRRRAFACHTLPAAVPGAYRTALTHGLGVRLPDEAEGP
ncbi:4-phosphoerythronate dehydrogenase [Rhodocaloribacter litoris]|uniref:4-phosphoerythronate dehydrogenase n=1 Tax=Rhodocaloribacter litoris TaxID=2558931 RepID=UPI0014207AF5|nr:4-phosphoerythronate dehydrogenase [Rhodocaloribacter litoris]QXD14560.1 4-phosphoerythronate dehydrogenase [Rhodocaloribacter litoris]